MKHLMNTYCQREGLRSNQYRFVFDGERLKDGNTPEELELENGDVIVVIAEQTGGRGD